MNNSIDENMLSIEQLKNLNLSGLGSENIKEFKIAVSSFCKYILNDELKEEDYTLIKDNIVNKGINVVTNLQLFIKSHFNISSLELRNLQATTRSIKKTISSIDEPYIELKEKLDALAKDKVFYRKKAIEVIELYDKVIKVKDIMSAHKDNRRCENLFLFEGRVVAYFLQSFNIDEKQLNLLDGISKTIADLESYELQDIELVGLKTELRFLANDIVIVIENLKLSYPEYFKANPYVFYTDEDFTRKLRTFNSDMKKKIVESFLVNVLEVLIVGNINIQNESLVNPVTLGIFAVAAVSNVALYNHFDKILEREEAENERIGATYEEYKSQEEKYLNLKSK